MLTASDVAKYFLATYDEDDSISNLKLQKLCYYAQGFSLAILERPLFSDPIEAWEHGPVVPDLYHRYKAFGQNAIDPPVELDIDRYSPDERELLDEIREVYGQFSAWRLREMTHAEPPWIEAHERTDNIVSHESMTEYFATLVD